MKFDRMNLDWLRPLARVGILGIFGSAQVALAFVWALGLGAAEAETVEKAFAALAPFTMLAFAWYKLREGS